MTVHTGKGWLGWNSSACADFGCHTSCGVSCSTNKWKLNWPYLKGCFGTFKANDGCTWPASREAVYVTGNRCPVIGVNTCHQASNEWYVTELIGGGSPTACTKEASNCLTPHAMKPYYGEANRAFMASLGITTTSSNAYANFSWST